MDKRKLLMTLALALAASAASAQTLRIGLAEDPDILDPSLARSFVGRIVFSSLCDKLVDIDEKLNIVPQLATSWQWSPDNKALTMKLRPGVTFHDGEKFDRRRQVQHRAPQDHRRLQPPRRTAARVHRAGPLPAAGA